jgi:hypothetical protein
MIIFINWSINSGKSTVARLLTQKIPQTANIEIDSLRHFIDWVEINKAIPINLENAVLLIKNFINHWYNVVIPYPISQTNYEYFQEELAEYKKDLYVFTLAPNIQKAQTSTAERTISDWEYKRIQHHYDIWIHNPSFWTIIDNTNQTPEETVNEILRYIAI